MFEWNKLCHSGRDMPGTGGKLLKVSHEELAQHCSDQSLWTSVRGEWMQLLRKGLCTFVGKESLYLQTIGCA